MPIPLTVSWGEQECACKLAFPSIFSILFAAAGSVFSVEGRNTLFRIHFHYVSSVL